MSERKICNICQSHRMPAECELHSIVRFNISFSPSIFSSFIYLFIWRAEYFAFHFDATRRQTFVRCGKINAKTTFTGPTDSVARFIFSSNVTKGNNKARDAVSSASDFGYSLLHSMPNAWISNHSSIVDWLDSHYANAMRWIEIICGFWFAYSNECTCGRHLRCTSNVSCDNFQSALDKYFVAFRLHILMHIRVHITYPHARAIDLVLVLVCS